MREIPSLRLFGRVLGLAGAVAAWSAAATAQSRNPAERLPGQELSSFLANLEPSKPVATRGVDLKTVRNLPPESVHRTRSARPQGVAMPTQASAEALVMLDPKLSPVDAKAALDRHRLEVLSTEPRIGCSSSSSSRPITMMSWPTARGAPGFTCERSCVPIGNFASSASGPVMSVSVSGRSKRRDGVRVHVSL